MTLEEQYRRDTGNNAFVARGECGSESYKYIMWLESTLARVTAERNAAIQLCNIYYDIASSIMSEDDIRAKRDAAISRIEEGK